jgi:hypothetical protein
MDLPLEQQKRFLIENGKESIYSSIQTDFMKDKVAVEVRFGKYSFVAYDLFVKHMMFFTGGVIEVGIEILPMKEMQRGMSSGIAYCEEEVYNLLRQGRGSPPVPLLIIGVAPWFRLRIFFSCLFWIVQWFAQRSKFQIAIDKIYNPLLSDVHILLFFFAANDFPTVLHSRNQGTSNPCVGIINPIIPVCQCQDAPFRNSAFGRRMGGKDSVGARF